MQLALPTKYPLRLDDKSVHHAKLACVLFFIDFCIEIANKHDFKWNLNSGVTPNAITSSQPHVHAISLQYPFGNFLLQFMPQVQKSMMKQKKVNLREKFGAASRKVVKLCINSILALIDRLSCYHLGRFRDTRIEFTKYLMHRAKRSPNIADWPIRGKPFTDRSQLLLWRPTFLQISEEEEVWSSYITMAASSHVSVTNAASTLTSMAVKDALIQGKTSPQSELQVETVISYEEESANNSDSDTQPKQQAGRKHQNQSMFDSTSSDDETIKPPIKPRPTISPWPIKTGETHFIGKFKQFFIRH